MSNKWFGMTRWSIDDVKSLAPEWSEDRCQDFIARHDDYLKDRMIELGWETLGIYVAQEKQLIDMESEDE